MAQAGPAPANTAFLSMETFEPIDQEPLSQASSNKAPGPALELQDPFYAGTTFPWPRESWDLECRGMHQSEEGRSLGKVLLPYLFLLFAFVFLLF